MFISDQQHFSYQNKKKNNNNNDSLIKHSIISQLEIKPYLFKVNLNVL